MRVLFLDIDGVLNHDAWMLSARMDTGISTKHLDWYRRRIDPTLLMNLHRVIASVPDLRVVVSSSWQHDLTLSQLSEILAVQVLDVTEHDDVKRTRGGHIQYWLSTHECDGYVIVDDDFDAQNVDYRRGREFASRFVRTYEHSGLTEEKADAVIALFCIDNSPST